MPRRKLAILIGVLILAAGSVWMLSSTNRHKEPKYRLERVQRGDVTATVTATGSLSALTTVAVGSQVSGIISKIYVDFNSEVTKGQLLAELDPSSFQAQLDQRRADLEKARVETRNARIAFERSKKLYQSELLSQAEYDAAVANVESMQATVKQTQAALRQAEENLSNTKIVSPINGVVVQRAYDIGQTVAASFQAPTLFTIAQDLTRMQVATSIDEADIGKIRQGQPANFIVDAFPERTFEGKISQIRLSTQTVQNVVTYPVLIDVVNPDLALKPGMTANVTIPVQKEAGVLRVPNAALRFQPDPKDLAEAPKEWGDTGDRGDLGGRGDRGPARGAVVYVPNEEGKLKAVSVQASLTDGAFTAITSGQLKEGDQIVTGLMTARGMENTGGLSGGQQNFRRSR